MNNRILHIILAILLPITIFKSNSSPEKINTHIPQTFQEIETRLHPKQLSKNKQSLFLKDLQSLRKIAQTTPIQVIHYQASAQEQQRVDYFIRSQGSWNDYPYRTIKVPANLRSQILILHSDVPVHWQFGSGNERAKVLFFTGTRSSSVRGSRFYGDPLYLNSFKTIQTDLDPFVRITPIDYLQDFKDEASYKTKVEFLLQRKVDKFIRLN